MCCRGRGCLLDSSSIVSGNISYFNDLCAMQVLRGSVCMNLVTKVVAELYVLVKVPIWQYKTFFHE